MPEPTPLPTTPPHGSYYDVARQRFTAVVRLGEKVCGWPRIVHGGLTAAIIDESLGGLLFGLKEVAFTVRGGVCVVVCGWCG